jgi:hypothetical protein
MLQYATVYPLGDELNAHAASGEREAEAYRHTRIKLVQLSEELALPVAPHTDRET